MNSGIAIQVATATIERPDALQPDANDSVPGQFLLRSSFGQSGQQSTQEENKYPADGRPREDGGQVLVVLLAPPGDLLFYMISTMIYF